MMVYHTRTIKCNPKSETRRACGTLQYIAINIQLILHCQKVCTFSSSKYLLSLIKERKAIHTQDRWWDWHTLSTRRNVFVHGVFLGHVWQNIVKTFRSSTEVLERQCLLLNKVNTSWVNWLSFMGFRSMVSCHLDYKGSTSEEHAREGSSCFCNIYLLYRKLQLCCLYVSC